MNEANGETTLQPTGFSTATPRPYLLMRIDRLKLALATAAVQEVVLMPELRPVPAAAKAVVGSFELRGELVYAVDLAPLLGIERTGGSDRSVVIIPAANRLFGAVVDEVVDVLEIAASSGPSSALTEIRSTEGIVTLLDHISLLRLLEETIAYRPGGGAPAVAEPALDPNLAALRHSRAERLRQIGAESGVEGDVERQALAIVTVGDAYYAIPLAAIGEFIGPVKPSRVAGAPEPVLGFVDLRGELLLLFDLGGLLGLGAGKAIVGVVFNERPAVAVAVDEVVEILVPSAPPHAGQLRYREQMLAVLDPERLLPGRSPAGPKDHRQEEA